MKDLLQQLKEAQPLKIVLTPEDKRRIAHHRKLEEMGPSEVTEIPWLHATRKTSERPKDASRSGKWMVFAGLAYIDEVWAKIKQATEQGILGEVSKVSTGHPAQLVLKPKSGVICVYVNDSSDENEKARVRQALQDLGCERPVFKTDAATRKGIYSKAIQRNRQKLKC